MKAAKIQKAGNKSQSLASCFFLFASCILLLASCSPLQVRPTVKIGLVAPFEGRYRYVGYDVIYAVRLALREANAAGGVGGYSVELVAYDDGADPTMALAQAHKLAVDPAVVAAIGHFRRETTSATLDAYAEASIPLLAPAVFDPALTQETARVYRLAPSADALASALLQRVVALGHEQAALATGGGPLGAAVQRLAPSYQLRIIPAGSAVEVMAAGVDAVLCDTDPLAAGEMLAALRAAGWAGDFVGGPELAASDFSVVAGDASEGALFVTPYPFPAYTSGGADFADRYQAVSNGVPPGTLALPAYEATWVLLEALERAIAVHGEPTRDGVAAALPATAREGELGWVAFDAAHGWDGAGLYWYRVGADGRSIGE